MCNECEQNRRLHDPVTLPGDSQALWLLTLLGQEKPTGSLRQYFAMCVHFHMYQKTRLFLVALWRHSQNEQLLTILEATFRELKIVDPKEYANLRAEEVARFIIDSEIEDA